VRRGRSYPLLRLPVLESTAGHLSSGDEPDRFRMDTRRERGGSRHVLVRLDADGPGRRHSAEPARDAPSRTRDTVDPALSGLPAADPGHAAVGVFAAGLLAAPVSRAR